MANLKASKKDIKRATRRQAGNKGVKTEIKTFIKKVRTAADSGDQAAAKAALVTASKKIDKAAQRGIIHKNQAARRKSRVAKAANKAAQAS